MAKDKTETKKELDEEKRVIQMKRKLIEKKYDLGKYKLVDIQSLSFTQKVYLGALFGLALKEDKETINPLCNIERKLAPTIGFSNEIMQELIRNRIILVNPKSPIDAFMDVLEDCEFPEAYDVYKVSYIQNLNIYAHYYEVIANFGNPNKWNEGKQREALLLWKRIALEECLECLCYYIKKAGFEFRLSLGTGSIFHSLLDHFSVSQIYGIIFRSIDSAKQWYQELEGYKKVYTNAVLFSAVEGCNKYGKRAILGDWELKKYDRIADCQQSMISEFFFNRVLKIGDSGFYLPPTFTSIYK